MLTIAEIEGVIFDVDDTLLDNKSRPGLYTQGLHVRSRLAAVHEVGRRHGIPQLIAITPEQSAQAFLDSPVHTLEGAVWQMLLMAGQVVGELDLTNRLLQEIVVLKNELHGEIILKEGEPIDGAVAFVRALAGHGLKDHMAIASTAVRRDIDIFLTKSRLATYFPESRIISKEKFTRPKPDPEAFDLAFASLNLPEATRQYVAAFEDDPRGIRSARDAGLFVCAITTRYGRRDLAALETPPDLIPDSYAEFADTLGLPTVTT